MIERPISWLGWAEVCRTCWPQLQEKTSGPTFADGIQTAAGSGIAHRLAVSAGMPSEIRPSLELSQMQYSTGRYIYGAGKERPRNVGGRCASSESASPPRSELK